MSDPIRLDIGCGKAKKPGFIGVDSIKFDGVDVVHDIRTKWPWEDSSVDEVHCSHVLEHLTNFNDKWERVHFFNELYRVLKPGKRENGQIVGGKATIIFPHWASQRYYGDPTHKEPFSEFGFYYLDKNWRAVNAPHDDGDHPWAYNCDLECTWGYSTHQALATKNVEYQQHAMQWWLEARQDIYATVSARK